MKNSFVCNLWSWSRVSIDVDHISFFSSIDWLCFKEGHVMFFYSLPPSLGRAFWLLVYTSGRCFGVSFLYILFVLPIKKKKVIIILLPNLIVGIY